MAEIDWDRIDKQKFFLYGVGMFSGVTTMLFPLTVLKTRQMASHGVSGGFEGTKQTASLIWKSEGIPGFYRGFGTVIFGTIPARTMYLTSLEFSKSVVSKLGHKLEVSDTLLAGISNGVGGASASLSTQLVTVPIDVVSQRQMVHGTDTGPKHHAKAPPAHTAAASSSTTTSTSTSTVAATGASTSTSTRTSTPHTMPGGQAAVPHVAKAQPPPVDGPANSHRFHTATSATPHSAAPSTSAVHHQQQQQQMHTQSTPSSTSASTLQTSRPDRPVVTTSKINPASSRTMATTASAPSTSYSTAQGSSVRLGGLQVARMIIKEEGLLGLYRGFGMSVATFVPNSAVWWAGYGVYQKLVWSMVFGSSSLGSDGSGAKVSTGQVMAVQFGASMLAGATSSVITNPLDLIKTRIQVARKIEGQAANFRSVLDEIIREDGTMGLFRGVLPRMANAALWGTCMVTVYEFLKRVSVKSEKEESEKQS